METNFKVDVPSFALGYSAGKKKVPPSQEKEVTIKTNGKTEILPDEGKLLSKVTVNSAFEGIEASIHYGDEPPEDSSKVWVKCPRPNKVTINANPNFVKNVEVTSIYSQTSSDLLPFLPYRIYNCASAVFGKTIYLFGGTRYNEETAATENSLKILAYDTEDNTCRELTQEMPGAFNRREAAVAVGNYIYIVYTSTSILRFNPSTETFDDTIGLDVILGSSWSVDSIGDKIYINSDELGVVDLQTRKYSSIGKPPFGFSVIAVDNKIFMAGDRGISCYDTLLETMTTPYPNDNTTGGDKIKGTEAYVTFGGREIFLSGYSKRSTIYRYDIYDNTLNTWSGVTAQTGSYPYNFAMKTIDEYIYLFGGMANDSGAAKYSNKVQRIAVTLGEVEADPGELVLWVNTTLGVPGEIIDGESFYANIGFGRFFYGDENGVGKAVDAYVYRNGSWEYAFRRY